jgi:hypothetical protein
MTLITSSHASGTSGPRSALVQVPLGPRRHPGAEGLRPADISPGNAESPHACRFHDLVLASGGHHPGLLVVRFDNDPRHNLTDRGIVTALANLESSGLPIPDQIHVLDHRR